MALVITTEISRENRLARIVGATSTGEHASDSLARALRTRADAVSPGEPGPSAQYTQPGTA